MKTRKLLFNLTIGITTLFFGLAWVAAYQFFLGIEMKPTASQQTEKVKFDISDPDSVLPIDFEEEKLSDPKEDENDPEKFDPEGSYQLLDEAPVGLEDFYSVVINNKNYERDESGEVSENLVAPTGAVYAEDESGYEFQYVSIDDGKIRFKTKKTGNIYYSFEGEFLVKGNFYTLDENQKVLKGVLRKWKSDKIVGTGEVIFGWDVNISCSC